MHVADDRQFQLVSFSADRRLRLWPISDDILAQAGHVPGSPITIPYPRRPASDALERSFRTFHEQPASAVPFAFPISPPPSIPRHLGPGPSLLSASLASSAPSLPPSSLLSAGFAALGHPASTASRSASPASVREGPRVNTAVMTATPVRTNRRHKAEVDQAWREGVKDEGAASAAGGQKVTLPGVVGAGVGGGGAGGESVTVTRASSMVRGTDGGTVTAREGGATERAESAGRVTESVATGTAVQAKERTAAYANLGDELTKVIARLKGGTINFEKVHIDRRSVTVSLKKGHFLRATFAFPKGYPEKAAPTIDLERNVDVPLKTRAFLLQSVRRLMARQKEKGQPSLELALRFLLGDRAGLEDEAKEEDDDDDDDADDVVAGLVLGDGGDEILPERRNPVPPPRRGGAVFDARGRLFYFSDVIAAAPVAQETSPRTRSPTDQQGLNRSKNGQIRVSDAFGQLGAVDDDLEGDYQETDEALQMSTGLSFREVSFPCLFSVFAHGLTRFPRPDTLHVAQATHHRPRPRTAAHFQLSRSSPGRLAPHSGPPRSGCLPPWPGDCSARGRPGRRNQRAQAPRRVPGQGVGNAGLLLRGRGSGRHRSSGADQPDGGTSSEGPDGIPNPSEGHTNARADCVLAGDFHQR